MDFFSGTAMPGKRSTDPERLEKNLLAWADVTATCLELRKAVLQVKTGIDDDEELTRMVFAEAVARKEQLWRSKTL